MKYMFTCKDISKVISEDRNLTFIQRLKYKIHLFICHDCTNFVMSMKKLTALTKSCIKNKMQIDEAEISQIEKRILESMSS